MNLSKLSRLHLGKEEIPKRLQEVNSILTYIDTLQNISTQTLAPTPFTEQAPVQKDEVQPSMDPELSLSNAPSRQGHFFKVPRMLGGE